jgi:hypothetical protein
MTTRIIKSTAVALIVIASAGLAKASSQSDQIAYQLGRLQFTNPASQSSAAILKQGQLAMATTTANAAKQVYVQGAVFPAAGPQSTNFQSQYYTATMAALTNPQTITIPSTVVTLANSKTVKVAGNLNPQLTTPAAVLQVAVATLPNYAPGWVSNAVAASLTSTWGKNTTSAQQTANAAKAASTALVAAAKLYPKGTVNVPASGLITNQKQVANAASAVAANAFNGLIANGQQNTNNIYSLAASLTTAAAAIQKTSSATGGFGNGSLGAEGLAAATQLAGSSTNSTLTLNPNSPLLTALVNGAGKSLGKNAQNITAFTYGVSQGILADYLFSGNVSAANAAALEASYYNNNKATIVNTILQATGQLSNTALQSTLTTTVNNAMGAFEGAYANYKNGVIASTAFAGIDGAAGINYFALLNGKGQALTDTSGL